MADEIPVLHVMDGKVGRRDVDWAIAELAERQHGVVARRQLEALGLGRGAIDSRLAKRRLHRVHRGTYAVGHRCLSREGRWMAAALTAGPDAVLSHRSAGQLWQLLAPSSVLPELTRPTTFSSRARLRAHCSPLPEDEVALVDRIPVTSLSRTFLDLAVLLSRSQLERALNEAEVRQLTDKLSIPCLLERYPRRRGSAVLRAILREKKETQGITRQKLEERFAELLAGTDLPVPRRNAALAVGGRFFEVDCLWTRQRVIVELDGRAVHGTDRAFERDRERDRLLVAEGWRVIRVTWRQLRDDAPAVLTDLSRLLLGKGPTL